MSIASSAASEVSCVFNGEIMNVEQALDNVTRSAQGRLTDLQMALRLLCMADEQSTGVDDDEDYRECVRLEDEVTDFVEGLALLLSELPAIAGEIRGKCPPESKIWYKAHKDARKLEAKKKTEEVKGAAKERKALVKQMKLTTIEESKN
jgi:hypothetical protein